MNNRFKKKKYCEEQKPTRDVYESLLTVNKDI